MDTFIDNLHRIHRVITRGLTVSRSHGERFLRVGLPDDKRKGYVDYARCLVLLLRAHHDGEEQMVFSRFDGVVDAGTMATLRSQHEELAAALTAAIAATAEAEKGAPVEAWLGDLVAALAIVEPRWRTHIALEEQTATEELLDRILSREEQVALLNALAEHAQKNGHVPQLALAFAIYNLEGADRAAFSRVLPPQLIGELLPGPWRAAWSPMQPFMLP